MEITIDIYNQEKDFIQACVRREKWAQKKLYEDHYGIMIGVCLRYARNREEAIDIVHDAFIKVFINIHKYKAGTSLKAWIRRIMVTTAIDHYRKESLRKTQPLENIYFKNSLDPKVISSMQASTILTLIQKLSPTYRTIFNMHAIEGYSHKEIAAVLSIQESTCRANLTKARNKLKELIYTHEIRKRK